MREILWHPDAWNDYIEMQSNNSELLDRVNALIKDIQRNGYNCSLGKPEMLKGNFSGCASVKINKKHRLIFEVTKDNIHIIKCSNHYNDR